MNKKWTYVGLATLLLLVIAGCGDKPEAAPVNGTEQDSSNTVSAAGEKAESTTSEKGQDVSSTAQPTATASSDNVTSQPTSTPVAIEKQSQSIEVYYTDTQVMELISAKATISFTNEVEKYTEAFKALQSSENADQIPLWAKIELKSLKFVDGQVLLDIHKPDEAQLGAGGESYAISSLAKTYFQFAEVKSVELLVDGEQVESLMGHVDLPHPMTRDNI